MIRKNTIAGLLLGLSFSAFGEGQVISRAYELTLADFRAPATVNGGLSFRPCADCDYIAARVSPDTRYTLDGSVIQLADLRDELRAVRDRESVFITVLRHLESNTVVSVAVTRFE
jgi:hypothetical protein